MIVAVDVKCIVHPSQFAKSTEKRRVAVNRFFQELGRFTQALIGPAVKPDASIRFLARTNL